MCALWLVLCGTNVGERRSERRFRAGDWSTEMDSGQAKSCDQMRIDYPENLQGVA